MMVEKINENALLADDACSFWLKEQLLLKRDPIDMLDDIEALTAVLNQRIQKNTCG